MGGIYIQNKASYKTSKKTSNWLNEHHIPYCKDWPTKGVDLNVIENVWVTLEQQKQELDFHNVSEMKTCVMKKM